MFLANLSIDQDLTSHGKITWLCGSANEMYLPFVEWLERFSSVGFYFFYLFFTSSLIEIKNVQKVTKSHVKMCFLTNNIATSALTPSGVWGSCFDRSGSTLGLDLIGMAFFNRLTSIFLSGYTPWPLAWTSERRAIRDMHACMQLVLLRTRSIYSNDVVHATCAAHSGFHSDAACIGGRVRETLRTCA
jgi:hypothetical protein